MGEYVEIRTSVSDIVGIANGLRGQGERLQQTAAAAEDTIRRLEERRETFPPDDFTNQFLETYHQTAEDSQGNATTVNRAVTSSAVDMGRKLVDIGTYVANAMWTYAATDQESGADINDTPRP